MQLPKYRDFEVRLNANERAIQSRFVLTTDNKSMLDALLHGMLSREQENMEDILTSSVFGIFRLAPPEEGLLPFLAESRDLNGTQPLLGFKAEDVHYDFWPLWSFANRFPCEPDVVLECSTAGRLHHVIAIEAKYKSGKSTEADESLAHPYDQLAREWDNLVWFAERRGAQPILIYLTADLVTPRDDIFQSMNDYRVRRPEDPVLPAIYWLTWRSMSQLFSDNSHPPLPELVRLASRLQLTFFNGFSISEQIAELSWHFKSVARQPIPERQWAWSLHPISPSLSWSFSP